MTVELEIGYGEAVLEYYVGMKYMLRKDGGGVSKMVLEFRVY